MAVLDVRSGTSTSPSVRRPRVAILCIVVAVTQVLGLVVAVLFPVEPGLVILSELETQREAVWLFFSLTAVNLTIGVPALALAGLLLVPERGGAWATAGAGGMVLGAGLYAAGVASWSGTYYAASDTGVLGPRVARRLLAAVNGDDLHLWGFAGSGAALVALGTILLSVGLWRAGTVARWVPVVSAVGIVLTFVLPVTGLLGLVVEGPVAAAGIAIGWYVWRREVGAPS